MSTYRIPILSFVLLLGCFCGFYRIASIPAAGFDESRNAINAVEMMRNGDRVNLHYAGEPDSWNCKPSLWANILTLSFSTFGKNEFGLRFPSVIFGLLTLLLTFLMAESYKGKFFALGTCLILLSSQTIFSDHVARSGDFDSMLLFWSTLSVYLMFQMLGKNNHRNLIWIGMVLGLGFLTKGPGIFPTMIALGLFYLVYVFSKETTFAQKIKAFFNVPMLLGMLIVAGSILLCWALIQVFGVTFNQPYYSGTQNAWDVLIWQDMVERTTSSTFDNGSEALPWWQSFVLLHKSLGYWIYVLYPAILVSFFDIYRKKDYSLLLFVMFFSIFMLLLAIMEKKLIWYAAPVFPFAAILMANLFKTASDYINFKYLIALFGLLLAFNAASYYKYLQKTAPYPEYLTEAKTIASAKEVMYYRLRQQDILLYLLWLRDDAQNLIRVNDVKNHPQAIILTEQKWKDELLNGAYPLEEVYSDLFFVILSPTQKQVD